MRGEEVQFKTLLLQEQKQKLIKTSKEETEAAGEGV